MVLVLNQVSQKYWLHQTFLYQGLARSDDTWHCGRTHHCSVCSVALACSSHSSTSLAGLIFTQTHSWAQSYPARWQCCHATSRLSQHMDWQPYCTPADKEQELYNQISGYELTASRAAYRTFVSNYLQPFIGPSRPFQAIQSNFQPF